MQPKFIATLSFRDFACLPEEVESLIGSPASLLVARGSSRRPGQTPFTKSAACWSINFEDSARLDEMIPALLQSVGGAEHLASVKRVVAPEFFQIDIAMWILDSEEQEGGHFTRETLDILADLGATLSCGFYRRHGLSQDADTCPNWINRESA